MLEGVFVPRWIVYCQAALLGLVAIGFFGLGIAVGYFSTDSEAASKSTFDCRVIGSVVCRHDGDAIADSGAVVFLLPKISRPDARAPGHLVNPDTFKALDNVAIDRIHELGGAVVRADENGEFDVFVDGRYSTGIDYYLLVVSKGKRGVDTKQMTKEQAAVIGSFFIPIEDVVEDRSFYWSEVNAYEERLDLAEVEFK